MAYIYVTGQWSKKTGKVAGVSAQWQYRQGAPATVLPIKKAGTTEGASFPSVAAMYDEIAKVACSDLAKRIKQYWDSFRDYYSKIPINSPQKSFD